ncbi:MAG: glycosyltransferase family 4 protein [Flavobacteriales bacterium]|nr:glycosyltransferase family 4 protein [Flavobacteriales bacterium]
MQSDPADLPKKPSSSEGEIRILHITPWFPSPEDPVRGIFIQRHIESLSPYCKQAVWHLEFNQDIETPEYLSENGFLRIRKKPSFNFWWLTEYQYAKMLRKLLKKHRVAENFTHVNFYIAYPALVHYKLFQKYLPERVFITEHWSAFQFNFGIGKIHPRIAQVFHHQLPIISVSKSLSDDIIRYSGRSQNISIVPNTVDVAQFHPDDTPRLESFFMVAFWKWPKHPLWPIEALLQLREKGIKKHIRIGGYGQQELELKKFVHKNQMEDQVTFLGKLTPLEVAMEMRQASAFLVPTEYETFSVVVAEAHCSGCPVIASRAGAIPELITDENGILVDQDWASAFEKFDQTTFHHNDIAEKAAQRYSRENVGRLYFQTIQEKI